MRYAPPRTARGRWTTMYTLAALALLAGCTDDTGPTAPVTPETGTPAAAVSAYAAVIGDDWSYASKAELKAENIFWWYRSEDVYQDVDLVPDATFGQVARIRFRQSDETGFAPKMRRQLAQPLDHAWYRWRIRYEPGWTTVGPNPAGYANSWKMSFWTWENYGGRGAIQLSNGDQNIMEWNVQDRSTGKFQSYAETVLPGSVGQPLGSVGEAWQDGEWYEYVIHYHRVSDTQARQEYWYRRLTSGGQIANEPFLYHGADFTGSPMPRMAGIELGVNKNKSNPTTMYVYWGPWEVVDGSRHPDPYGLAGGQGTPPPAPARTLTGVTVTPGRASLATGDTVRLAASGSYSDGTTGSVAVTWSASGGTVSTSGLYRAPATGGTYRVIARDASGPADTAVVTVGAPGTAAYTRVLGDDWRSYTDVTQLSHYYPSWDLVNMSLVSDPVFGTALRVTQPAGTVRVPRLERSLPAPMNRVWYRWRVKYAPGWSSGGGWTMAQMTWDGANGAMGQGYAGTSRALSFSVRDAQWRYVRFSETLLSGSQPFGAAAEHADGDWYEYVMHWQKTASTSGRAHWWMRRVTRSGAVVDEAWTYHGVSLTGGTTPPVTGIKLGAGALSSAPARDQHLYWGPWEVVDGETYLDPFDIPGI